MVGGGNPQMAVGSSPQTKHSRSTGYSLKTCLTPDLQKGKEKHSRGFLVFSWKPPQNHGMGKPTFVYIYVYAVRLAMYLTGLVCSLSQLLGHMLSPYCKSWCLRQFLTGSIAPPPPPSNYFKLNLKLDLAWVKASISSYLQMDNWDSPVVSAIGFKTQVTAFLVSSAISLKLKILNQLR